MILLFVRIQEEIRFCINKEISSSPKGFILSDDGCMLYTFLPITSPLLGVLSYGLPIMWIVVEALIEVFLIRGGY